MASEITSVKKKKPPGFMTLLSCAACEWFLIFLLFLDALFSYLLTKFAHYCDLDTPCPLCSRIDHIFEKTKPGYYRSLLCSNHKEEISSLVSCSIHSNLVDVNGMCEECLTPIAMLNKSKSESYKLLVGKLWVDVERSVVQNLMLNKSIRAGSSSHRTCSCCNKKWRSKSSAERLLELSPISLGAKANIKPPLPRVPRRSRFSRWDSFLRLKDIFPGQISRETLSDVGYSKIKISSDSESEVPMSEDDNDAASSCSNYSKIEYYVFSSEKQTYKGSEVEPLIVHQPDLLDISEGKNVNSLFLNGFMENGLREQNWAESHHKPSPRLTQEFTAVDDVTQLSDVGGGYFGASSEISNVSLPHMSTLSVLSELLSLNAIPSSSNTMTVTKKTTNVDEEENASPRIHLRNAEGLSLDDGTLSESNSKNLTEDLTESTEKRKLSCKQVVEPIKTGEEMKSLSQAPTSESGSFSKNLTHNLTQSTEKSELSGKQAVEPLKTGEEMKSISQVSTSEVGLLSKNLTDNAAEITEKRGLSGKQAVTPIDTEEVNSISRVSISDVGLPPKGLNDKITQSSEQKELSCKQMVDSIKTEGDKESISQVPTSELGLLKNEKEIKSILQVSTSKPGLLSKNVTDNLIESIERRKLTCKVVVRPIRTEEEMKSLSQVSASEVGLLAKALTENSTPSTRKRELSCKQAVELNEEEMESSSKVSNSEAGLLPKHDNMTDNTEQRELSCKQEVEPIKTDEEMNSLSQVSISERGLLSRDLTNKLAQSIEKKELSCKEEVGQIKAEEEMKSLSQESTSNTDLLSKHTSPRARDKQNESIKGEDNNSSSQEVTIPASVKRNDSSYESLDETSISSCDTEGENIIDQLKRQAEHDRNALNSLYKELEEERNAAAVSANEAMAMITRLQEEKAALHMEALQYLRMMEEQAEYDMEALQRANDLLSEREKELQDLESELEYYKNYFADESGVDELRKENSTSKENYNHETGNNSVSNFEDEILYISQCLKKLENKFHSSYCGGKLEDMPNGLNCDIEEMKDTLTSNGIPSHDIVSNGTIACDKENEYHGVKISEYKNDPNSATFENEIAILGDKLEALENDRDFLKHASNLLQNGNDGLRLIEEIAYQLQELRNIEFKNR